jgi:hypothetical protein
MTDFFTTATPYLLAVLAGLGWLYRREYERRRDVENQVSERKYNAYIKLINIFFDMFKATRGGPPVKDLELRMFDVNKELMLFASDRVLQIVHRWLEESRRGTVDLNRLGEIIVAIRKDMGNSRTRIRSEDMLRQLILDFDKMKASGQLVIRKPPVKGR